MATGWVDNIHVSVYIRQVNWKPIQYHPHAVARLRGRKIRRQQVRELLATGTRRRQGAARWTVDGTLGRHAARLVILEDARSITVLTVMWITRHPDA